MNYGNENHHLPSRIRLLPATAFSASKDLLLQNLFTNKNLWVLTCTSYTFCFKRFMARGPEKVGTGLSDINKLTMT